ncbi:MAG: DUF1772 domain-containing protein [Terracidiphilus sp.]
MNFYLNIAAILSIGLMVGTEFTVWAFINPILEKLEAQAREEAIRLFARKLGKVMPFWYAGNFLLLVVDAFLLRSHAAAGLLGTAAGIWAAVIILTLIFLVPINNRLARQDSGLSRDEAHRQHQRWDMLHRARVIALSAAFVLLLLGVRS